MQRKQLSLVLASVLLAAGCGSSSGGDANATGTAPAKAKASASSSTTTAAHPAKLAVEVGDMYLHPAATSVTGGDVQVTVRNAGKIQHEVVFLKTDQDAATLQVTKARLSEASSVGEVADVAGGSTKSKVVHLAKGHYVLVCNIAGHYMAGMRANLTVT